MDRWYRWLRGFIVAIGLSVSMASIGASALASPPDAGPDLDALQQALLSLSRQRLEGGPRIVVVEDHRSPAVAFCAAYPARPGVPDDEDAAGVAASGVSSEALALVRARGGRSVVQIGAGVRSLCHLLPSGELALAAWLEAERLRYLERRAALPPGTRGRSILSRGERDGSALTAAVARVEALVFQTDGSRSPALSAPAPSRSQAVLVAVGDVERSTALEVIRRYFDGAVQPAEGAELTHPEPLQSSERLAVLVDRRVGLPTAHYAWPLPALPDHRAAAEVAVTVLAGGDASRLRRLAVRERARARQVMPILHEVGAGDLAGLTMVISPHSTVDRAQRLLEGTLKQLRLVGPSAAEVARAARWLRTQRLIALTGLLPRAVALARAELLWGDAEELARQLSRLGSVTPAAVKAAAARYLIDTRRTAVEIYPEGWPHDDPALADHRLHTVAEGETVAELAARYGVDPEGIVHDNDLDPSREPVAGEVLWIPPGGAGDPAGDGRR